MIREHFDGSEAQCNELRSAIRMLQGINAFGLFLELGAIKATAIGRLKGASVIEANAIKGAWHDGYVQCLHDICHYFDERDTEPRKQPNFNAPSNLYISGEIDDDEYKQLTGSPPDAKSVEARSAYLGERGSLRTKGRG